LRIDRTHKGWLVASLVILFAAFLFYARVRVSPSQGSMGGTTTGLCFGGIAFAFMIFAAALGVRKRFPVYRVGRAQTWMRGHLWLGLISLPLALFHSGFRLGHGLTAWLMALLTVVVASGLFGAALQHYMPQVMTREVPMETIYDEIGHVRKQLLEEAEGLLSEATGMEKALPSDSTRAESGAAVAVAVREEAAPLQTFYEQELRPFLEKPGAKGNRLGDAAKARVAFSNLRTLLPPSLHTAVEDLEGICEEERQLTLQSRLHVWLHGWLLLHIPLSLALILLGAIHAVMALRY
jgi:hypothetical protein